jgi:hypothetical protein
MRWDVFISHASEDKAAVVRPLQQLLENLGLHVWVDESQLKLGDSLTTKINEGLAHSRYGVVVLSPSFFAKQWPRKELDSLYSLQTKILPVFHGLGAAELQTQYPLLADIKFVSTVAGIQEVALKIVEVVNPTYAPHITYPDGNKISRDSEAVHQLIAEPGAHAQALSKSDDEQPTAHINHTETTKRDQHPTLWRGTARLFSQFPNVMRDVLFGPPISEEELRQKREETARRKKRERAKARREAEARRASDLLANLQETARKAREREEKEKKKRDEEFARLVRIHQTPSYNIAREYYRWRKLDKAMRRRPPF